MEILGSSFLSDLAYAKCGITAVTRAAEAPLAASAISSSSTRFSCTGGTSGWIRYTSRSRQFACNCTWRQSLANRVVRTGLRGTPRSEQISSASSGCARPPKMTMSASTDSLRLATARIGRDIRRQPQLGPDLLLHGVTIGPGVNRDHELLAPEQFEHRVGLLVILAQPHRERLLRVVVPGRQLPAARIAAPGLARAVADQVVVHAALGAQPPVQHPAAHLAVRQVEVDHRVDVVAFHEELGLPCAAREAVDKKPVVPVVLGQPALHHGLRHVVPDELPAVDNPLHLRAHLGVVQHIPPEDVAHADMHQVQVSREHLALGALPAALHAHDHVLAHDITLAHRRPMAITSRPAKRYAHYHGDSRPRSPGHAGRRPRVAVPHHAALDWLARADGSDVLGHALAG